ncbi:SCO1860 family LAETG-anchored protein [Streptomyces sp. TRM49041]|uniref:SCO1860 family LAETG-anchored protein n=1 Tax=Streptomyces sp. TRM49041 TaxID=2603216 RepID=UPI0011EE9A7C|nr:SCO1860 family LAETG-anchored protein [Streptomyces sp. TRM49041]
MNSNTFRFRLSAVSAAVAALAAGAPAAHATTGDEGRASAAVLRTGLDVSLLDGGVRVPLKAVLNEVHAPAAAEKTALTVELDGVDQGRPVTVLRADAATAEATADARRAEARVKLARAKVHVPGLPLLSLIQVEQVTAEAVCEAGGARPVAESNLLGPVTVLGKRVTVKPGGRSGVRVPGVGEVTLDLSRRTTTTTTAAATALELKVAVNPLALNVADVQGTVTLAEANCTAPKSEQPAATGLKAQSGGATPPKEALAETGTDSRTPYVAAGATALLAAGAASLLLARRKRT